MNLILIGFVIGIGKVLPGVSGSMLAIRFKVYYYVIEAISTFFDDFKNNAWYLFRLGVGFISATIIGSKLLFFIFESYQLPLKVLFTILIITGFPELLKKSKSIGSIVIMTIIIYLFLTSINNLLYTCPMNFFIAGIIEAISTIIPGLSGTSIYLNLGWYDDILLMFSNLYLFEFSKIVPFFIGFIISSLFTVKFIYLMINKSEHYFYSFISALMINSIILLFI